MENNKIKLAIVDDEISICKVLEKYFQKLDDVSVITYTNPATAISSIDESYDAVLLDIMMPQMDGIAALEKLVEKNSNLKVVMMTAYSTLDKVLNAHKNGASGYLLKPFNSLSDVEKKIREVLKS